MYHRLFKEILEIFFIFHGVADNHLRDITDNFPHNIFVGVKPE